MKDKIDMEKTHWHKCRVCTCELAVGCDCLSPQLLDLCFRCSLKREDLTREKDND